MAKPIERTQPLDKEDAINLINSMEKEMKEPSEARVKTLIKAIIEFRKAEQEKRIVYE